MKIAVSGTPGTGKTEVSKELSKILNYEYIELNKLAEEKGYIIGVDKERNSKIIDSDRLKNVSVPDNVVIDGHLSHFVPVDLVVVLRTRPDVLRERLKKKGWLPKKVEENVEAEVLGVCVFDAEEEKQKVIEIDTTNKTPEVVAKIIRKLIEKRNFTHKNIDWMEDFAGV